jgi:uncharacterized delta-60 repeat protein
VDTTRALAIVGAVTGTIGTLWALFLRRIVIGGRAGVSGGRFALARYHSNGRLDRNFSHDGKVATDFSPRDDPAFGLALQADGKIVAVGQAFQFPHGQWALARYNPNGTLDPAFSDDGKETTDFTAGDDDWANNVVIQPDGRILAGGGAAFIGTDFALARYETDGTLDSTFGGDGRVRTNLGGDFDEARDLALQDDGRIVAVGENRFGNFAVVRYNPDGLLDASFGGGDGKVSTPLMRAFDTANAVSIQADGKILAAGVAGEGSRFGLARYFAE